MIRVRLRAQAHWNGCQFHVDELHTLSPEEHRARVAKTLREGLEAQMQMLGMTAINVSIVPVGDKCQPFRWNN